MTPASKRVYVATGFRGWGMTNGTAGAMLLRDLIVGRENPAEDVFDPNRLNLASLSEFGRHGADIAQHLVGDRLSPESAVELRPGDGCVAKTDAGQVAMYRDEAGTLHTFSPACTHMGCILQWNNGERSWDCPCHGSRYTALGKVIHGPAITDMERKG